MVKFKFHYLNQTLAYQKPYQTEYWYEIAETFAGNFGSLGFKLKDGWMTFSVYEKKIRVFYKQGAILEDDDFWEPQQITYYRKDLPKQVPIIFEFTPADKVEKLGNAWVKKGGSHG